MKIFGFVKKIFFVGITILSNFTNPSSLNAIPLTLISMNNQPCKARPEIVNVNSNNPIFYPFSIKTSCNNINYPYAKICAPNIMKNLNVKVFHLMSRTNETKHIKWHETCKCKCRLDAIVCNNKQRWNKNKYRCECKALIIKEYVIKDLFGILVIVSVNVIKLVILVNI